MSSSGSGLLKVSDEVKVNTRAVLLSSKNGVALKRFNRDYKKLLGIKWWLGVDHILVEIISAAVNCNSIWQLCTGCGLRDGTSSSAKPITIASKQATPITIASKQATPITIASKQAAIVHTPNSLLPRDPFWTINASRHARVGVACLDACF